jgi:hypothetical protein
MDRAEAYTSKMLLLAPIPDTDFIRCSSWLTMRLANTSVDGWNDFSILVLLVLKDLQGVKMYSLLSLFITASGSVHFSREERFRFPFVAACSPFKLQLPFECINLFEEGGQRLLLWFHPDNL